MNTPPRPVPVPTQVTRPFWDAARAHRLVVQTCRACGRLQFYPRPFCRHCLGEDLAWHDCSGRGRVYTYTVNHRAANPHMADRLPYAVAMVSLEEGVRMMGNIVGPLDGLAIGAPVHVRFLDLPTCTLPQFVLDTEE